MDIERLVCLTLHSIPPVTVKIYNTAKGKIIGKNLIWIIISNQSTILFYCILLISTTTKKELKMRKKSKKGKSNNSFKGKDSLYNNSVQLIFGCLRYKLNLKTKILKKTMHASKWVLFISLSFGQIQAYFDVPFFFFFYLYF